MPNDGKRREIVDGELLVTPSPNLRHQRISRHVEFALLEYLKDHPIGELLYAPIDVILSDFDVLQPDLVFVLNEHRGVLKDWVRGAPDLVVEILSSTTAANDRGPKMKTYARFGVPECWLVDPDQRAVEIYRLVRGGYRLYRRFRGQETLSSPLLPDFALAVGPIFQY